MNTVQGVLVVVSAFCFGFFSCGYLMLHSTAQGLFFQSKTYALWRNISLLAFGTGVCLLLLWLVIDIHERTEYDIQSVLSENSE